MHEMVDMHCHMIYGVDDGAKSKKDVRELLQLEYDSGVRRVILTPHYRKRMFEPPADLVMRRAEEVKLQARHMGLKMKVYLGCEYHANSEMIDDLKKDARFRMNGGKYVLIEFSSSHRYQRIYGWILEMVREGFRPIIAHVERYPQIIEKKGRVEELIHIGALIQVDAGALLGEYGFKMKMASRKLLKNEQIHFIGSDAHDTRRRKPNLDECARYVKKKMGTVYANELFVRNPQRILEK